MIFLCLSFYITPKGVQILYLFSFLQSCQPYGFKDIILFVNQYFGKKYVNLRHKILIYIPKYPLKQLLSYNWL